MMSDNNLKKGFDLPSTANLRAYQVKPPEMTQGNMQFAVEFGKRLATSRSPFEVFAVIAEFTSRRIDMFGKYAKETTAL